MELKEAEVHLTYRNKKTGETFKDRKEINNILSNQNIHGVEWFIKSLP